MKIVILAGGLGTRISEESLVIPKPLIEIGGRPLLWHIMKIYSFYGYNDFIIACGYKGEKIKQYFSDLYLNSNDFSIETSSRTVKIIKKNTEDWKVTLVDTGLETMTGGRLKRVEKYIKEDTFMATYGDGLSDINITELLKFHVSHGKKATVSAARMPRFGILNISNDNVVTDFQEKRLDNSPFISAGFFVLSKEVLDYIGGDNVPFETTPLQTLAEERELVAYKISGFFRPLDTINDKKILEDLWHSKKAPWKVW